MDHSQTTDLSKDKTVNPDYGPVRTGSPPVRPRPMGPGDKYTKRTSYKLRRPRGITNQWFVDPDSGPFRDEPDFLCEDTEGSTALGPWRFPDDGEPYRVIGEKHIRRYVHGEEADYSLKIINCLRILRRKKVPLRYVDPPMGQPSVEIYLDSHITTPGWYSTKEVIQLFGRLGSIAQLGEAFINVSNDGLMSISQFLRELENVRFISPFNDEEIFSSLGPVKTGPSEPAIATGFPQGEDPYGIAGVSCLPWSSDQGLLCRGNNLNPDDPTECPVGSVPLPRVNCTLGELELFFEELCDSATWSGTIFPEIYLRKEFLRNLFFKTLPFGMEDWYPRYRWIVKPGLSTKLGRKGFLLTSPESIQAEWGQHPDRCPPTYRAAPDIRSQAVPPVKCSPSDEGYW